MPVTAGLINPAYVHIGGNGRGEKRSVNSALWAKRVEIKRHDKRTAR